MQRNKLLEKTARDAMVREIVVLGERHDQFLRDLIEEVSRRTSYRLNKSTIVRSLIEAVEGMGMETGDITSVYRARRDEQDLMCAKQEVLEEIDNIENDLRLALIDEPQETAIIRQFRRNLRYQKERLKAVEKALAMQVEKGESDGSAEAFPRSDADRPEGEETGCRGKRSATESKPGINRR